MARQGTGLGGLGKQRAIEGVGAQGREGGQYEKAMFGPNRPQSGEVTPWETPASSRVLAYQYDYDQQQLRVRFVKPVGSGTPWVYENVPPTIYQAFAAAPSKGKYVNSTLNYFPYHRATPQQEMAHFMST